MSDIALPFLTLPEDVVTDEQFLIGFAGNPLLPIEEYLQGWDYARDVEVHVRALVDMQAACTALAIPPSELRLCAILHAGTGTGSIVRQAWELGRQTLHPGEGTISIGSTISGVMLSGRLQLNLQLVLAAASTTCGTLSPRLLGSRLWSVRKDVLLEDGGASRFPVELTSFNRTFPGQLHESAPWYVDWHPNALNADFGGSVRVYVNSDNEAITRRFVEGDPLTLQAIIADVMTQMTSSVLEHEDPDDLLAQCEDGSVGQQIRFWFDSAFPGLGAPAIAEMMRSKPNEFRAALLALGVVGEG